MIDPGTALAIVGLVLDVSKGLYEYYALWKGRDEDIAEVRLGLLWLNGLFVAIQLTLTDAKLPPDYEVLICQAIDSCQGVIQKLEKRLEKSKKEGTPATLLQKVGDQARRTLYPFQKGTIARIAENVNDCKQRLHMVISLVNMDTTAKGLKELRDLEQKFTSAAAVIDTIHKIVVGDHEEEDRQKILDWLRPANQSDLQAAAIRRHETGTGEWFLKGEAFHRWRQQPGSSLWINGSVGCGKTVLFSSIVRELELISRSQPGHHSMAYFYCLYRKGARHSLAAILQSFVSQLCPKAGVPTSLRELYKIHNQKFPPGVPSNSELKETLLTIIKNQMPSDDHPGASKEIYLLIDALDEWPIGFERDELLSYLVEMVSHAIPHLHILVTSREEPDIRDILTVSHSWANLTVSRDKVSADIELYVKNEIEKHRRLSQKSPEVKDQIMKRLVTEGNGMFRWAALQIEAIKKLRPMIPQTITRTLKSLPKDLDHTYERLLSDFNEETLTALRWIAFATRPLLLEEFIDACAIKYSGSLKIDQQFDLQNRFSPSDVLDLLPGLITIDPPLQDFEILVPGVHIVTFAHFSVQEYLLGDGIKLGPAKIYSLDTLSSNHSLARDCLSYLRYCNSFPLRGGTYPLRGYAWDYWAWHAQFEICKPQDQIGSNAQSLFESVVYQERTNREAALDNLLSLLSDVSTWYQMPQSAKRELCDCLRIPYFYEEFDTIAWQNKSDLDVTPRQYEYQPLQEDRQEIRLFELFPSPKVFTEIRCKMFTVSLAEEPKFDALSFVWGNPAKVSYIRMNGLLLQIPRNLIDILRAFRAKDRNGKRVLFADSISVRRRIIPNERSTGENLQIAMAPVMHLEMKNRMRIEMEKRRHMMPQIFKAAQHVAIGLGKRDEADVKAIDFVREITAEPIEEIMDKEENCETLRKSYDIGLGPSVLQLFKRKWWLRSWPIQEVILPSRATLYYGDMAVTFETFQKFFQMENKLRDYLDTASYDALVTSKAWIGAKRVFKIRSEYAQGRMPPLPELIWATQLHEARRYQDKMYVLIGLQLLDEKSEDLLIRHSSIFDLLTGLATYIVTQNPTVDILSYASCHPLRNSDTVRYCPSWVPNFAIGQTHTPLICGNFGPRDHEDIYDAGKQNKPPEMKVLEDSKILNIKGFRVDKIEGLSEEYGDNTNIEVLDRYKDIMQVQSNVKLPPGQSSLEAYWRSIHLDQWDGRRFINNNQGLVKDRLSTIERATALAQTNDLFDLKYCQNNRFFTTPTGYFGLGPAESKAGDLIVVFHGGKVPYVLRSHQENYTLVGECYVHGIMDGEIMERSYDREYMPETFSLI